MHDTLDYMVREPVFRRYHHDELMRPTTYAFTERFLLPLSHDEVVHGKQSLAGKLPGYREDQLAGLRGLYAYQWAFPGKQLLFMGAEFGQHAEWSEERGLDWGDAEGAAGLTRLLGDLNRVYKLSPALWAREDDPLSVRWPVADRDANVIAMLRFGPDEDALACVVNFSGVTQRDYPIGLPWAGKWTELVNTDAKEYGGSGEGNLGVVQAVAEPFNGEPASATVTLAAGAAVWLVSRYA
jgi:1,4-alpha-glucan branching enzyme